jgi:hypothetical protein
MRSLGEKNLRIFANLHEAVLGFIDRHFRRLKRHTQKQDPGGIANFLHIFRALAGVLHSQATRIIVGLEATKRPLSTNEWSQMRSHFDTHYYWFKKLMVCLWTEYLAPVRKTYGIQAIKDELEPELESIHLLCIDMLTLRDRVERLRTLNLRIAGGINKPPEYFQCVFSENRWPSYKKETTTILVDVEKAIVGHPLQ